MPVGGADVGLIRDIVLRPIWLSSKTLDSILLLVTDFPRETLAMSLGLERDIGMWPLGSPTANETDLWVEKQPLICDVLPLRWDPRSLVGPC